MRPVEEVLHQVMDIVFEHMPADRGFLMLEDETGADKLVPMVVKHRSSGGSEGRITVSKTITDRVMHDRVSILTSDAMVDPRFGAGDSIRFHGIRSAMCAPLWNKDEVIGIIHVDSPMLTNCFTVNDLDLLTALANYAAVAVERARLNQKIVAEEKKRERLGRFLSPQVASRILAASDHGAELGPPEVREVTILFADISGFTSMSETMSPSAVALLLNDYLSRMTDVIFKYEGTLDKYIGDAIMAVFGAPLDMPDHARARDQGRARDAGAARRVERRPQGRPGLPDPDRDQLRQRHGGRDRQHQQEGVHGARRHREHREPPRELGGEARLGGDRRQHLRDGRGPLRVPLRSEASPSRASRSRCHASRSRGSRASLPRRPRRGRLEAMAEKSPPHRRGRILFSILGLLLGVGVLPLVWTSIASSRTAATTSR